MTFAELKHLYHGKRVRLTAKDEPTRICEGVLRLDKLKHGFIHAGITDDRPFTQSVSLGKEGGETFYEIEVISE